MMTLIAGPAGTVLAGAIAAMLAWPAAHEPQIATAPAPMISNLDGAAGQAEPTYEGKPLSYWLNSLRKRDSEMPIALDAIRALGPEAKAAVPELTKIVGERFEPIHIGVDSLELIISKLADIQLRSYSVDALASIGDAAAPSSATLIRWALTIRVVRENTADVRDWKRFIDLAMLDILERMRVTGAIAQFGDRAIPEIAALVASPNDEERKLGVAILSEDALPIAAKLLKSENCKEREAGIAILVDMWPVAPREHLIELKDLSCASSRTNLNTGSANQR